MEQEFIYWRHHTPAGIKIEEISGAEYKNPKVWLTMAYQIYCEQGKDGYRDIGHFPNGAPFLFNEASRISISHTHGMLVVATLPRTPEATLSQFSQRTAMGVDVEKADRKQVIKVNPRILSPGELKMVGEDLEKNILAWTSKEALYKAAFCEGLDMRDDISIEKLPFVDSEDFGKAYIRFPDGNKEEFNLYSYNSDGYIITLAFSPKCAKFMKHAKI